MSTISFPSATATQNKVTTVATVPTGATRINISTVKPVSAITGQDTNTRRWSLVETLPNGITIQVLDTILFSAGYNATPSGIVFTGADVVAGDIITFVSNHVGTGIPDPGGTIDFSFS